MIEFQTYRTFFGIRELYRLGTSISIGFDTETLQLQPEKSKLRLIQLGCLVNRTIVVIDCFDLDDNGWIHLDHFFNNGERFWIAHNAVFDLGWLQEHGIYPRGKIGCTMLASRLLTNGIPNVKHGLDALTTRHLRTELPKEQQRSDWSTPELSEDQLEYAAKDVVAVLELDSLLERKLAIARLTSAYALECRALPAMAQMWRTGLPWNKDSLQQCKKDYEHDVKELGKDFLRELDRALPFEKKLPRDDDGSFNLRAKDQGSIRLGTKKYRGFNLNSPKQLLDKFETVLGFTPRGADGKPSASRQALRGFAADHEVVQTYLTWKKKEKRRQMITSIEEKMDSDGFVRASYMQLGADTGRMSCIKPNNQQIPRDDTFRRCVEAPDGWVLVDADFSQMELRLAACLANDEKMIEAFKAEEDLHTVTAEAIGCERQIAKSANFGLLYGSGAKGLRNYAGASGITMTEEKAAEIRHNWLLTFKGIAKWQQDNSLKASETESDEWAEVRVPGSEMRRFLKGDLNRLTVRCNTPIQGAGAAILKCALGSLWKHVKEAGEENARIAAAVHDEILLLVREGTEDKWGKVLKDVMEEAEAKWLGDIPSLADVSTGKTWREVH